MVLTWQRNHSLQSCILAKLTQQMFQNRCVSHGSKTNCDCDDVTIWIHNVTIEQCMFYRNFFSMPIVTQALNLACRLFRFNLRLKIKQLASLQLGLQFPIQPGVEVFPIQPGVEVKQIHLASLELASHSNSTCGWSNKSHANGSAFNFLPSWQHSWQHCGSIGWFDSIDSHEGPPEQLPHEGPYI